jgi:hypothetical protein
MKKTITILTILLASTIWLFGQQKQDTTIVITVSLDQYRALLYVIDQNIDSKKVSKEVIELLQKSAAIKPKEIEPKKK